MGRSEIRWYHSARRQPLRRSAIQTSHRAGRVRCADLRRTPVARAAPRAWALARPLGAGAATTHERRSGGTRRATAVGAPPRPHAGRTQNRSQQTKRPARTGHRSNSTIIRISVQVHCACDRAYMATCPTRMTLFRFPRPAGFWQGLGWASCPRLSVSRFTNKYMNMCVVCLPVAPYP